MQASVRLVGASRKRPGRSLASVAVAIALTGVASQAAPAGARDRETRREAQIVQAIDPARQQGTGIFMTLGPAGKVWGFDGAYGCGGEPADDPFPTDPGARCGLFSVDLDGRGYRFHPIPDAVVADPGPGTIPTTEEMAGIPALFRPRPNRGLSPYDIVHGPDGNIWFTVLEGGRSWIGKMTPSGGLTVYPMADFVGAAGRTDTITDPPRPSWGAFPIAPSAIELEAAPDGRLYFSVYDGFAGSLKTDGPGDRRRESWIGSFEPRDPLRTLRTWGVPGIGGALTVGPDDNVWFMTRNKFYSREPDAVIGRIDIDTGALTSWRMPAVTDVNLDAVGDPCCVSWTTDFLKLDARGRVWYSIEFVRGIGRLDPKDGSFTFFRKGFGAGLGSGGIEIGDDGMLYQVDTTTGDVLRIDQQGRVKGRIVNPKPSYASQLIKMPDGTMWMADHLLRNVQKVVGVGERPR